MMNDPLISVLLPVYNEEMYISQSIDSILNQTYENFEFISPVNVWDVQPQYKADFNKVIIVSISLTLGKFFITTSLSNNNVAAKIGREEFLEPGIETFPLILEGPLIKNLSIYVILF